MSYITVERYLSDLYYDTKSPVNYAGLQKFWTFISKDKYKPKGINKAKVKTWLQKQDTHSVFSKAITKFKREKIIVGSIDELWCADLADMQHVKQQNDGIGYLLVVIDVFSKYLWVVPIKRKTSLEVIGAMKSILASGRKCSRLFVDAGSEFHNKEFKLLMSEKDIHMYTARNENKTVFCERVIKTLKTKIYKSMYAKQSYKYISDLNNIVTSYNNAVHSSIKMPPSKVNYDNELQIYLDNYLEHVNRSSAKDERVFKPGDYVRVSYLKDKFTRAYHETFSEEIFKIYDIIRSKPNRYLLKDTQDEKVKGSFYASEIVKVNINKEKKFKIDKILKYRTVKGKKEGLVRWYGYSKKFDSWEPVKKIKNYVK